MSLSDFQERSETPASPASPFGSVRRPADSRGLPPESAPLPVRRGGRMRSHAFRNKITDKNRNGKIRADLFRQGRSLSAAAASAPWPAECVWGGRRSRRRRFGGRIRTGLTARRLRMGAKKRSATRKSRGPSFCSGSPQAYVFGVTIPFSTTSALVIRASSSFSPG